MATFRDVAYIAYGDDDDVPLLVVEGKVEPFGSYHGLTRHPPHPFDGWYEGRNRRDEVRRTFSHFTNGEYDREDCPGWDTLEEQYPSFVSAQYFFDYLDTANEFQELIREASEIDEPSAFNRILRKTQKLVSNLKTILEHRRETDNLAVLTSALADLQRFRQDVIAKAVSIVTETRRNHKRLQRCERCLGFVPAWSWLFGTGPRHLHCVLFEIPAGEWPEMPSLPANEVSSASFWRRVIVFGSLALVALAAAGVVEWAGSLERDARSGLATIDDAARSMPESTVETASNAMPEPVPVPALDQATELAQAMEEEAQRIERETGIRPACVTIDGGQGRSYSSCDNGLGHAYDSAQGDKDLLPAQPSIDSLPGEGEIVEQGLEPEQEITPRRVRPEREAPARWANSARFSTPQALVGRWSGQADFSRTLKFVDLILRPGSRDESVGALGYRSGARKDANEDACHSLLFLREARQNLILLEEMSETPRPDCPPSRMIVVEHSNGERVASWFEKRSSGSAIERGGSVVDTQLEPW